MLRHIDDSGEHEHDERDRQLRRSYIFNPCCCISLTGGAYAVGIFDILIGAVDLYFSITLDLNTEKKPDKSPNEIYPTPPPYVELPFVALMERWGCSLMSMITGILLILATKWAGYFTTIIVCIVWLLCRSVGTLIQSVEAGAFLSKSMPHYIRSRGYQVLANILIHVYFTVVIVFYAFNTYEDLKDTRAIVPFHGNIALEESEDRHIEEISRMHNLDTNMELDIGQRKDFIHLDICEFKAQVSESRASRMAEKIRAKRSSYNDAEYQKFLGKDEK